MRKRAGQRCVALASVALWTLAAVAPAAAREDDVDGGEEVGAAIEETIVVTAQREEQPLERVPVPVDVLDDELERTAAVTVDDALRQLPSFSLFRRSSSLVAQPTTQGVSLRGIGTSGTSRTLVLYDGVPLNDPFGGWVYWSRIPRVRLGRAETMPSGGSDVWGTSALGGVVQLLTRDRTGRAVDLLAEGGERGTLGLEASAGFDLGRGRVTVIGDLFETDGYRVVRPEQRGTIDVPATSEHDSLRFEGDLRVGERGEVAASLEAFGEERGNGTPLTANATDLEAFAVSGSWQSPWGSWRLGLRGQDQEFSSTFSAQASDRGSETPALDQFLVDSSSAAVTVQWSKDVGARQRWIAGAEGSAVDGTTHEDYFYTDRFQRRRRAGGEQVLAGVWLQDSVDLGAWSLQLGARLDRWETADGLRVERQIDDGTVLLEERYEDRSETTVSPKLGVVRRLSASSRLGASLYRAFRSPTINELYRPFRVRNDITAANPLLDPELLTAGELSWWYTGRRVSASAAVYGGRLEDSVANLTVGEGPGVVSPCGFVPAGGSCRQRRNVERTRIAGVESELRGRLTERWTVAGLWSWMDSELRRVPDQPELEGKIAVQSPEHRLSLRTEYRGWLDATLQARWTSKQFEDDLNRLVLEPAWVWDLWLGRVLTETVSVFAAVENVLDEEVEVGTTADGLVTIGGPRLVYAGVRLALGAGP